MWRTLHSLNRSSLVGGLRGSVAVPGEEVVVVGTQQSPRGLSLLHTSGASPGQNHSAASLSSTLSALLPPNIYQIKDSVPDKDCCGAFVSKHSPLLGKRGADTDFSGFLAGAAQTRHRKQYDGGEPGFSGPMQEAVHLSYFFALGYSLLHKQGLDWPKPEVVCPVLAIKTNKKVYAQPPVVTNSELGDIEDNDSGESNPILRHLKSGCSLDVPSYQSSSSSSNSSASREETSFSASYDADVSSCSSVCSVPEVDSQVADGDKASCPPPIASNPFEVELESLLGVEMVGRGDPQGVVQLEQQARLGSSVANFYLGMVYEQGAVGVEKDLTRARLCYEESARADNSEAKYNLAIFHINGWGGLKEDEERGVALLSEAADDGVVQAKLALGK